MGEEDRVHTRELVHERLLAKVWAGVHEQLRV
jgi:hypothetical protein